MAHWPGDEPPVLWCALVPKAAQARVVVEEVAGGPGEQVVPAWVRVRACHAGESVRTPLAMPA